MICPIMWMRRVCKVKIAGRDGPGGGTRRDHGYHVSPAGHAGIGDAAPQPSRRATEPTGPLPDPAESLRRQAREAPPGDGRETGKRQTIKEAPEPRRDTRD